ncbi:type IV pilus biogenesis protein PilM [Gorillibacterium massiliense]|uniref:type IV pilus biogenesis protein PilM n=1 Tax=Gorillibacterium massiliense TaxID=1280390 RepID=UPI0004B105A5|nr:pilus assembly protein PilM [Gorillibacterium massiliense]
MFGFGKGKAGCGLHIHDTGIKLIQVKPSFPVKVLQAHAVEFEDQFIKNGTIIDEDAVTAALGKLIRKADLRKARVHLALPTSSVVMRKSVFPSVHDKEMRNLIDVELYSSGQLPFSNPSFDYIRLGAADDEAAAAAEDSGKSRSKKQEQVMIITTSRETVDAYTGLAYKAGLEPVSADIPSFALYRLLCLMAQRTKMTLPESFMILHVEKDQAEAVVFQNGVPTVTRTIPIFGAKALNSGAEMNIEAYTRSLQMELSRLINYYKYSVSESQRELDQIFLTGNPELLTVLPSTFEGLVKGGAMKMEIDQMVAGTSLESVLPYAIPLGLALKGAVG